MRPGTYASSPVIFLLIFTCCPAEKCPARYFRCVSGQCILSTWQCDGQRDCADGSDEANCGVKTCSADQFACTNGRCIPRAWLCDGDRDCQDGKDELQCGHGTCSPRYFQCRDMSCVPKVWLCDGERDCRDGSDEENYQCSPRASKDVSGTATSITSTITTTINNTTHTSYPAITSTQVNAINTTMTSNTALTPDTSISKNYGNTIHLATTQELTETVNSTEINLRTISASSDIIENVSTPKADDTSHSTTVTTTPDGITLENTTQNPVKETVITNTTVLKNTTADINTVATNTTNAVIPELTPSSGSATDSTIEENTSTAININERTLFANVTNPITTTEYTMVNNGTTNKYVTEAMASKNTSSSTFDLPIISPPGISSPEDASPFHERLFCAFGHFRCSDSSCILLSRLCDGDRDCRDGSDEDVNRCSTASPPTETASTIPSRTCSPRAFQCANGRCISKSYACDGDNDCGDGSDEAHCSAVCGDGRFFCDGGRCILKQWRCDKERDCADGSDEENCFISTPVSSVNTVPTLSFTPEVSNDRSTTTKHTTFRSGCPASHFECADHTCLFEVQRCDGNRDCNDGSDEEKCTHSSSTYFPPSSGTDQTTSYLILCTNSEFQCKDHICIPDLWRCNGDKDCIDGSDEESCPLNLSPIVSNTGTISTPFHLSPIVSNTGTISTPFQDPRCPSNEFQCPDGQCLNITRRCDGNSDCSDGSDENNCTYSQSTSLPPLPSNTAQTTTHHPVCADQEFQCRDGTCIPEVWWCDGDTDCSDGSDEDNCGLTPSSIVSETSTTLTPFLTTILDSGCPSDEFRCPDGQCLNTTLRCNGNSDCSDGSDEDNCTNSSYTSPPPSRTVQTMTHSSLCADEQFQCREGTCIPEVGWCDGDIDCVDGSDEDSCGLTSSTVKSIIFTSDAPVRKITPTTSQSVLFSALPTYDKTKQGSHCSTGEFECPDGKCIKTFLKCDGHQDCVDKSDENDCPVRNSCKSHETKCKSGTCIDSHLWCDGQQNCVDGSDETSCSASILMLDTNSIARINLNTLQKDMCQFGKKIRTWNMRLVAVDFDPVENNIYFTDVGTKRIYRGHLINDTSVVNITSIVKKGLESPDGVAVDWIHRHVYWTDSGLEVIKVATLDGSMEKMLVSSGVGKPRAIALEPSKGWMYWTDWGRAPMIVKCGMDGIDPQVLVNTDIRWPNGLTIDYAGQRLYWIDARNDKVSTVDLEGKNRRVVWSSDRVHHAYGLTMFGDYLFWSDWIGNSLRKVSKLHNMQNDVTTIATSWRQPMGVVTIHPSRKLPGHSICGTNNGGCSHFCLPRPKLSSQSVGYRCECPDDKFLQRDLRTCVDAGLIFGSDTGNALFNVMRGSRTVPRDGSRMVPHYGTRTIPFLGSRTIPRVGSRTVPRVGSRTIPFVGSRMVPRVGSRTVPRVGSRTIPRIGSRTIPRVGTRTLTRDFRRLK